MLHVIYWTVNSLASTMVILPIWKWCVLLPLGGVHTHREGHCKRWKVPQREGGPIIKGGMAQVGTAQSTQKETEINILCSENAVAQNGRLHRGFQAHLRCTVYFKVASKRTFRADCQMDTAFSHRFNSLRYLWKINTFSIPSSSDEKFSQGSMIWWQKWIVGSHEAAHHLFGVFWAPRVGEADKRAVDSNPGTPLELQKPRFTINTEKPSMESQGFSHTSSSPVQV